MRRKRRREDKRGGFRFCITCDAEKPSGPELGFYRAGAAECRRCESAAGTEALRPLDGLCQTRRCNAPVRPGRDSRTCEAHAPRFEAPDGKACILCWGENDCVCSPAPGVARVA